MSDEQIGAFPIRQDVTVLPAGDQKLWVGWVVHEIPPNVTEVEYWKERLSPDEFEQWLYKTSYLRNQESDDADVYRTSDKYNSPGQWTYTSIEVLQFLWGQPWNNLALRFVHSLRPSAIRVSDGTVTCDAYTWRVTVFLEKDDRTIRKITQEVQIGGGGNRSGSPDLWQQLEYQKKHGNMDGFRQTEGGSICVINEAALSKINFD